MAKKSILSSTGRRFLAGARSGIQKRGLAALEKPPVELVRLPTGKMLNGPESQIYRALEDLNANFSAQEVMGGGTTLGGSLADFVLFDHNLILEYNGPFHDSTEGAERDFWRRVAREQAGFMVAYLYERDLVRLHRRLTEIMGAPAVAAAMSKR